MNDDPDSLKSSVWAKSLERWSRPFPVHYVSLLLFHLPVSELSWWVWSSSKTICATAEQSVWPMNIFGFYMARWMPVIDIEPAGSMAQPSPCCSLFHCTGWYLNNGKCTGVHKITAGACGHGDRLSCNCRQSEEDGLFLRSGMHQGKTDGSAIQLFWQIPLAWRSAMKSLPVVVRDCYSALSVLYSCKVDVELSCWWPWYRRIRNCGNLLPLSPGPLRHHADHYYKSTTKYKVQEGELGLRRGLGIVC